MLIPDHETAVDLLNYQAISKTVINLLSENRETPVTIGVHGSWGAGKSSVLKMIEEGVAKDNDVLCLWFNGWTFQGFDDAKIVLIETIIDELRRKRSTFGKVQEKANRLLKRVDWLKSAKKLSGYAFTAATGVPSIEVLSDAKSLLEGLSTSLSDASAEDIQSAIGEAASLLKDAPPSPVPEVMHKFREEFAELLEEAKIDQLVILIDDLDRCLPKTAIETLEAIRLFLFVPKSAFVVAADEAMIEYSVKQHFPDLPLSREPTSYARNYLEKLIQVPFRIPSMGVQETKAYVTLLLVQNIVGEDHAGFLKLLDTAKRGIARPWDGATLNLSDVEVVDNEKKAELTQAYRLGAGIGDRLAEGTRGNPRQIKRFLNSMLLRMAIADALGFGAEIRQDVLAKLMLAEMFQSDFYDELAGIVMRSGDGKPQDLKWLEGQESEEDADQPKAKAGAKKKDAPPGHAVKWFDREQLVTWAKIAPELRDVDLRPYVFVARDKRMVVVSGTGLSSLDDLKLKLSGGKFAAVSAEQEVKALTAGDAETLFNGLREEVLLLPDMTSEPKAFEGLRLIAKHHKERSADLLAFVGSLDAQKLGPWILKGWNGVITTEEGKRGLNDLMVQWSKQDQQPLLKQAAAQTLASKGGK